MRRLINFLCYQFRRKVGLLSYLMGEKGPYLIAKLNWLGIPLQVIPGRLCLHPLLPISHNVVGKESLSYISLIFISLCMGHSSIIATRIHRIVFWFWKVKRCTSGPDPGEGSESFPRLFWNFHNQVFFPAHLPRPQHTHTHTHPLYSPSLIIEARENYLL